MIGKYLVMVKSRGQAALDFLMTYGWALLLIVLVVGALFSMGIFDMGMFMGSRATGFAQVSVSAWQLNTSGYLNVRLRNNAGKDINVTSVNATMNTLFVNYNGTNGAGVVIYTGKESASLNLGNYLSYPSKGSSYSVKLDIQYVDLSSSFNYSDAGTLSGKVG